MKDPSLGQVARSRGTSREPSAAIQVTGNGLEVRVAAMEVVMSDQTSRWVGNGVAEADRRLPKCAGSG